MRRNSFELVKEAFDAVAPAVEFLVVGQLLAPAADGRNDGFNPVGSQALADAVGIVTFVERGELKDVLRVEAFIEGLKLPAIVRLACGQVERDRAVFVERGGVDFGGEAPARAAQSLVAAVFFGAPAACGWARTVVESTSTPRAPAKGSA